MTIASSAAFLNDVPFEFIKGETVRIGFDRGFEPNTFYLRLSENRAGEIALLGQTNPCSIRLTCSDASSTGSKSKVLSNWYIKSLKTVERGWVLAEVADVRWRRNFAKFTGQFNILSYGTNKLVEKFRKDSLKPGGGRWRCVEAAKHAFEKMGFEVVVEVASSVLEEILPNNLGNSAGGGFFAATFEEVGRALLQTVRCDVVTTTDGRLCITDEFSDLNTDLRKFIHIAGDISPPVIHWQQPKKAEVHFERRIERRLEFDVPDTATGAPSKYTPQLENVIPQITKEMQDLGAGSPTPANEAALRALSADAPHVEYVAYVRDHFVGDNLVRERWFKKSLFIGSACRDIVENDVRNRAIRDGDPSSYEAVNRRYEKIEENVRQCRWQRFRIKTASPDEVRSRFADLELGRLQADGTTKPEGVYCNYIAMLRQGRYTGQKRDNPILARFSANIDFDYGVPAPWVAHWVKREELIFELLKLEPAFNRRAAELGRIDGDLKYVENAREAQYGDERKGGRTFGFEPQAELANSFKLRVFFNGLWVGNEGRTTVIDNLPMFGGGEVDKIVMRVEGITANYGYDGTFPGKWLNEEECRAAAEARMLEAKATFLDGRSGYLRCGGVDALVDGKAEVKGDVHAMAIEIGARGLASIDTVVQYHTAMRPVARPVITPGPGMKRGKQSKAIL